MAEATLRQPTPLLLTGATGLLGQYLLWHLAKAGEPLTVLVRPAGRQSARERVQAILDGWAARSGQSPPAVDVVEGDLKAARFGLGPVTYGRLASVIDRVLHCGASVVFRRDARGDPEATNIEGTAEVLRFARFARASQFHHVSTAYVCGCREGVVREDDLDVGQAFRNVYEQSKCTAEKLVRQHADRLAVTVYRPAVVVGDSRTGYTPTFHGLYHLFRLGQALAQATAPSADGWHDTPLRVAAEADQPRHFVPVDYVAEAILWIWRRPALHGRTYHLTHPRPPRLATVKEAIEGYFHLRGIRFVGRQALPLTQPNAFEELFYAQMEPYLDYLTGEPAFDRRNAEAALAGSGIMCPELDPACLRRLLDFAVQARWGRNGQAAGLAAGPVLREYFERFLGSALEASTVARATGFSVDVAFQITGAGDGPWLCRFRNGRLAELHSGCTDGAQVLYTTDPATFAAVVSGRLPCQRAFLEDRVAIRGDLETGLKLGALFARFIQEHPFPMPRT